MHCFNARFLLIVAVAAATGSACADPVTFGSSATLVPPVPVSERVEVEMRVAVRNNSTTDAKYAVAFEVTGDKAPKPQSREVSVPALGQQLVSFRLATQDLAGVRDAVVTVTRDDEPAQSHVWPLTVWKSDSRAVPLLQVGWIEPGAYAAEGYPREAPVTEASVRAAVDAYRDIGFRSLILGYPESVYSGGGFYYPTRVFEEFGNRCDFDVIGTILNQASKNGQQVFVGLGRGADLNLTWTGFDDPQRNADAIAHSIKVATELWTLYGDEPSFYGWYLSHEANAIARASASYYNPVTRFLRTFEADKPVLISPSGTPEVSPDALKECEADVIVYQDAVGAGYVPYKYTYDPDQRIQGLDEVFAAYAEAHRGARQHLWSNLEVWRMDGPEYRDARPAELEHVLRQLEIERAHVDVMTAYALPGFLEPPGTAAKLGGEPAVRLFEGYREHFLRQIQAMSHP